MWITKSSGKIEKFSVNKVKRTCIRAGASREFAEEIANKVRQRVRNGMTTRDILEMTLSLLRKQMPTVAARYDLKGALMRLGPAGFMFEHVVAEILKHYDYRTKVHSMVRGGSEVIHEVDVIAVKSVKSPKIIREIGSRTYCIECKYHNSPGMYTGVKDVLYTYARFLDLQDGFRKGYCQKFDQTWLATNTKFSNDVVQYALAKQIRLLGWDYPTGESLREMIEQKKLYPITVLRNLDQQTLVQLARANIVLISTLLNTNIDKLSDRSGVSTRKLKDLINESEKLLE